MVKGFSKYYYDVRCDVCGKSCLVEKDIELGIYNSAQAVRSLGWHFGRDKKVTCLDCEHERCIYRGFIFPMQ